MKPEDVSEEMNESVMLSPLAKLAQCERCVTSAWQVKTEGIE